MLEDIPLDAKIRKFDGGSYTYPKKEIGTGTDLLLTYVPDLSDRVGKGTRQEVEWALDMEIPVICITDFEVLSVKELSGFREDNWTHHALIEVDRVIVKNDDCVTGKNDITIAGYLRETGLLKPSIKRDVTKRLLL